MYFGVDYHPEQWVFPYGGTKENPEAEWEKDIEMMVAAGVNVVRIGEYTWGLCEREEGKFDFAWMTRVMDQLHKAGIKVVTCDAAYGMHPDVICPAESLPFAEGSFDLVACRTAAHHFDDVETAVRAMRQTKA